MIKQKQSTNCVPQEAAANDKGLRSLRAHPAVGPLESKWLGENKCGDRSGKKRAEKTQGRAELKCEAKPPEDFEQWRAVDQFILNKHIHNTSF